MPPRRTPEQEYAEQATGRYFQQLLLTEKKYYRPWLELSRQDWAKSLRTPPSRLDLEAVGRVLERQACIQEDVSFDPDGRKFKDTIRRAVSGEAFSKVTLDLAIKAFSMTETHGDQLRDLREGGRLPDFIRGHLKPIEGSSFRNEHQTLQLHETHYISPVRQPVEHRTIQTIKSLVDGMRSYQFRFVPDDGIDLKVGRGGTPGQAYPLDDRVHAIDIELDQPLDCGERASLEYVSIFKSPTDHPPYFNRAVRHAVESLEICVVFLGERPREVLWAEWDGYQKGANIVHEESWRLKGSSVDRRLARVEQAVFGFRWVW